ncbi:TPA: 3-deoxy-manno-octulosonate cytidylyltransferase [Candidatus Galligastranaerophilus intestinavium]|uniref:3-deoxy-manno-octulosonate cytidylyltransferase n=1 Tax=Candidatus Galligastranaerophilus intestinavium TaxID=2840836 RepID=A0A9D1FIR0_9BACT|nr:3-deoxy-manno-octulosonate cytidylyltransferase [Candidatus Galligastranaerophilus intestinavium]
MKKTVIIIPARYSSTRLCGKLLIEVDSKPIIQWVWEAAKKSKLADEIIIATDSELIFNKAKDFGANVEMTSVEHKSGSDRICEVAKRHSEYDYILNMQGDEPQITPEVIDLAISTLTKNDCDISTLVRQITDIEQIQDPNCVKCVFDNDFNALYFSRCPIPYERNKGEANYYAHIGIYGYKRESLIKMTSLEQSDLEKAESLEQLRALKNGMKIKVAITKLNPIGIDTQRDLNRFKNIVEKK